MNSLEKEIIIEKLNFVIHSKSNTLSNTDIEFLVTVREQIRRTKTKEGISKILTEILQTFFLNP